MSDAGTSTPLKTKSEPQRSPAQILPVCPCSCELMTQWGFSREDPPPHPQWCTAGRTLHVIQSSGRELCWRLIVQHCRGTMEESYRKGNDLTSLPSSTRITVYHEIWSDMFEVHLLHCTVLEYKSEYLILPLHYSSEGNNSVFTPLQLLDSFSYFSSEIVT